MAPSEPTPSSAADHATRDAAADPAVAEKQARKLADLRALWDEGGGPYNRRLGMRPVTLEPGHAVMEMTVGPELYNPALVVHGGALASFADTAMAQAYLTTVDPDEVMLTVELKINYLRAVTEGVIRADARTVTSGRRLGFVTCEISDAQGRLLAHASCTCMRTPQRPGAR